MVRPHSRPSGEVDWPHSDTRLVIRVYVKSQGRQGKIVRLGAPINGVPFYSVDLGGSAPSLIGELI